MLGDPELVARRDPRSRTAAQVGCLHKHPIHRWGASWGLAAQLAINAVPSEFGMLIVASLVGAVIGETVDVLFAALTARVRGRPMRESIKAFAPMVLTSAPVYAPIVALLAFMYVRVSPWTLALFLVPAMAAQRLYGLYQEQRQLAVDLSTCQRDARAGEPSVRRRFDRDLRCTRSVHGRSLGSSCDLLTRHRVSDGTGARGLRSSVSLWSRA